MTPPKLKTKLFMAFALASTLSTAQAQTDTTVAFVENAEERINFSGKLRMLSQRIPSAACHLSRDIDAVAATALLANATEEFAKILSALEYGDTDLNIQHPETRRKTLLRISELKDRWRPFESAAQTLISGDATAEDLHFLLAENKPLLDAAQILVEELVRQYSNPNASTQASLMLINISGRQRMLTQKMAKEACVIDGPDNGFSSREDLAQTMQIFEASLEALRFGLPQVGIVPPPDLEIAEGLTTVVEDWATVRPYVAQIVAGNALDEEQSIIQFQGLNVTMATMNDVVGLYTNVKSASN